MAGRCELGFETRLWGFRGHNPTGILQGVQAMVSVSPQALPLPPAPKGAQVSGCASPQRTLEACLVAPGTERGTERAGAPLGVHLREFTNLQGFPRDASLGWGRHNSSTTQTAPRNASSFLCSQDATPPLLQTLPLPCLSGAWFPLFSPVQHLCSILHPSDGIFALSELVS